MVMMIDFSVQQERGVRTFSDNGLFWTEIEVQCYCLGHGAYFADDPRKSHKYTAAYQSKQTGVMFYNKVILGKESVQAQIDRELMSAPKNYHSVRGTHFTYCEYIVYRYGQALPYLKITYNA